MAVNPTFQIEGINKLVRALEKMDEAASEEFKAVGLRVGQIVADKAKTFVPVRSGRLQKTIRPVKTARGAKVRAGGTRVPYAGVIHFGWRQRNIRDNPFLYKAVDAKIDEVVDIYLEEVYKVWNRNV